MEGVKGTDVTKCLEIGGETESKVAIMQGLVMSVGEKKENGRERGERVDIG